MPDDLTALRDRLAGLCGFEYRDGCWFRTDGEPWPLTQHPFPEGDLTALAAAWPEGVRLRILHDSDEHIGYEWIVQARWAGGNEQRSGATEYEARLRLTVAVREAMASDPP